LTISTASLLLSLSTTSSTTSTATCSPTTKSTHDSSTSTASSLSLSLTNSSQTPSPVSSSPISINKNKRISLIQVSPQNYYYYQQDNTSKFSSTLSKQQNIQSPQDENGYLIPITIIDLSDISNKSNVRRNGSMKVENRSNKKKVIKNKI
jgi:hypothetical protein